MSADPLRKYDSSKVDPTVASKISRAQERQRLEDRARERLRDHITTLNERHADINLSFGIDRFGVRGDKAEITIKLERPGIWSDCSKNGEQLVQRLADHVGAKIGRPVRVSYSQGSFDITFFTDLAGDLTRLLDLADGIFSGMSYVGRCIAENRLDWPTWSEMYGVGRTVLGWLARMAGG